MLVNMIRTPDGTIMESRSRHDYRTYVDENGLEYMVDGGLEYARRTIHSTDPFEELSLTLDDEHEVVRGRFSWGTYSIDGNAPYSVVILKAMSDNHIKAILETQDIREDMRQMFVNELKWRGVIKEGVAV